MNYYDHTPQKIKVELKLQNGCKKEIELVRKIEVEKCAYLDVNIEYVGKLENNELVTLDVHALQRDIKILKWLLEQTSIEEPHLQIISTSIEPWIIDITNEKYVQILYTYRAWDFDDNKFTRRTAQGAITKLVHNESGYHITGYGHIQPYF